MSFRTQIGFLINMVKIIENNKDTVGVLRFSLRESHYLGHLNFLKKYFY